MLLLFGVVVGGNVSSAEYEALVDFYSSLNGPQWGNQSNWLSGDPCVNSWFVLFFFVPFFWLMTTNKTKYRSLPSSIAKNLFNLYSLTFRSPQPSRLK